MRQLLLLVSALALVACQPSLSNDPVDDDDGADDDDLSDDDDLADDDDFIDDDDLIDDDDDDDDNDDDDWFCGDVGSGDISIGSPTLGFDFEGTWYEGELAFDGSELSLTLDTGEVHTITVSWDEPLWNVQGFGSLFWYSPLNSGWGTDSLLAIDMGTEIGRVLIGNSTEPPPSLSDVWGLDVVPDTNTCSDELEEDECGVFQALPVQVHEWVEGGPTAVTMVPPDSWIEVGDGYSFVLQRGAYYPEVYCMDFYEWQYSYAYWFALM
jgi:hypothetical protein